jgi:hypothetical protein
MVHVIINNLSVDRLNQVGNDLIMSILSRGHYMGSVAISVFIIEILKKRCTIDINCASLQCLRYYIGIMIF